MSSALKIKDNWLIKFSSGGVATFDDSVWVNGVAIVIIIAVLTHRKRVILKYNDIDRSPSSGCASSFVRRLQISGKMTFIDAMYIATIVSPSFTRHVINNADAAIKIIVRKTLKTMPLYRCESGTERFDHRIADGSAGSSKARMCWSRNLQYDGRELDFCLIRASLPTLFYIIARRNFTVRDIFTFSLTW